MAPRRRGSGNLEAEVLTALWAADRPLTPREVTEAVDADLAYTTVQTVLTRLHEKGAVRRRAAGRAHAYTPVLDQPGLAAQRMRALLQRGGDYDAVLTRFVSGLSEEQQLLVARLLRAGRLRSGRR